MHATKQGVVLGTAAYMSPEQARGLPVDRRTDIWAFGCVFYEMLTGTPAFARASVSDIVAAVLQSEPDWERFRRTHQAVSACCSNVACRRTRKDGSTTWPTHARARRFGRRRAAGRRHAAPARTHGSMWAAVGVVAGVALAGMFWRAGGRPKAAPTPIHLSLVLAKQGLLVRPYERLSRGGDLSDGQKIVYVAIHDGRRQLFLRSLGEIEGKPVDGTDGALTAFFSADSQWIAFGKGLELQKAAVGGGLPVTICTLAGTGSSAATGDPTTPSSLSPITTAGS